MSPLIRPILFSALVVASAALVYRAWTASLGVIEHPRLVVPMKVDQPSTAQLYYDRGDGLSEADSTVRTIRPAASVAEVAFPVPRVCLQKLRFDPLTGSGTFAMGEPRFVDSSGRLIAKITLGDISALHEIAELKMADGKLAGATVPGATDPQLEFRLKAPLCVDPIRFPWIEALIVAALIAVLRRCTPTSRTPPAATP